MDNAKLDELVQGLKKEVAISKSAIHSAKKLVQDELRKQAQILNILEKLEVDISDLR